MDKPKLGILFGGCSEEHPVSVKSAREVARHLDADKYEPLWIRISPRGEWTLCESPDAESGRRAVLSPDREAHGLLVLGPAGHETIRLDVVLPVLHGKLGEDGAVQGLLELAGIPYVGCDIASSALCMDKSLAYLVVRSAGIATPDFWVVSADGPLDPGRFDYPVVVKPARSGSSFGVTKVSEESELSDAVIEASRYDSKVLIEATVVGAEIGCAVMGDGDDVITGEVDQVSLSHGVFRIHQEVSPETGSDNSTVTVPADIPAESRSRVRQVATAIYRALGCRGLSRVDMFLRQDGTVVLNEVNTLPGLTSYSRYPRMMTAAGIPFPEMIDRLVSLALTGKSS